MSTTILQLASVIQGDRWTQLVNFQYQGHDFTGVTVRCQLRRTLPDGPVVYEFSPTPSFVTTSNFNITLDLTGDVTAGLLVDRYWGSLVISQEGFGPYTPIQFQFLVTQRTTQ